MNLAKLSDTELRDYLAGEFVRDLEGDWWSPVRHTSEQGMHVSDIPLWDGWSLQYTGADARQIDRLAGFGLKGEQ